MLILKKSIKSTKKLVELKMKMSEMGVEGLETHSLMAINLLMDKLEQLNTDLVSMTMVSEVRLTCPIVGNVLDNAKKVMGLVTATTASVNGTMGRLKCNEDKTMGMPKCDEDLDNDEDFVEEILVLSRRFLKMVIKMGS